MRIITNELIIKFKNYLLDEEKADATIEKYVRDVTAFTMWIEGRNIDKSAVLEYKTKITDEYAPASVNSMLTSINAFFEYNNWHDCKVKFLKIQKQIFASADKELSKEEYKKLLKAASDKNNQRLLTLMQTLGATGIRISELRFITVEAVKKGKANINCKGKMRVVILSDKLCKILNDYIKSQNIKSGCVFITRTGKPLDRTNIWKDLKKLCESANVPKSKVFPHNFRHLFARTYYSLEKDISRLADILGHSSVDTTRIYTIENGTVHKQQLQRMDLLLC